jgi:hypothetical protein
MLMPMTFHRGLWGYKAITDKADFLVQFLEIGDWRADIFNYLKGPAHGAPKRI